MPQVDTANLAMGPGDIYVSDFGAAEPLDSQVNGTPAASAYTNPGGTLGGMVFTVARTYKELEVDQITETPERRLIKVEVMFKTKLAEVTFDNLVLALNGGTITDGGVTHESYDPDDVTSGDSPEYKKIIFDGFGGAGKRRRVVIRKALSTDNLDVNNAKEDQSVYPVTWTSHYVGGGVKSWRVINSKT